MDNPAITCANVNQDIAARLHPRFSRLSTRDQVVPPGTINVDHWAKKARCSSRLQGVICRSSIHPSIPFPKHCPEDNSPRRNSEKGVALVGRQAQASMPPYFQRERRPSVSLAPVPIAASP